MMAVGVDRAVGVVGQRPGDRASKPRGAAKFVWKMWLWRRGDSSPGWVWVRTAIGWHGAAGDEERGFLAGGLGRALFERMTVGS